ncbi:GspE/PulE family protein [Clostridium sp. Ade.TY]|uniref:GspE/PulE family protein n=1 Tax=Clostridium sp. Ade.TY TaxID=1391647 RepID=UPI000419403C|nr:GspE/PulE family protein [Clostridium sp. Ade.TY]
MKDLILKIDLNCIYKIEKEKMIEYKIIPLYIENENINVATYEEEAKGKEFIQFVFSKRVNFIYINKNEFYDLIHIIKPDLSKPLEEVFIKYTIDKKGSDIHFEPFEDYVNIRVRIDGNLILISKIRIFDYNQIISRVKLNGNMDIAEKRKPQDGKTIISYNKEYFDCRVSIIPLVFGEKMVIRILYKEKSNYNMELLNLSDKQFNDLNKIINAKNGIVVINGPTGSGKSTTLYSIISQIKNKNINITTIEDPVECNLIGVNQINVNNKINLNFANGLRSILRQDPDVIMVGEIRDEETANIAIRAAITGHKVYSTIHTKSSRDVFFRFEDMNVKDYLIRDSMIGAISQRLIGCLCENCKTKKEKIINNKVHHFYEEVGCKKCNYTGISGRKLICAVHFIDEKVREKLKNINENLDILSNKQMYMRCKELLDSGEISYKQYNTFINGEELLKYEVHKKVFI